MSEDPVVALVLLRSASGRPISGASRITAETLGQYAPDPADVESVTRALQAEGFEVGPLGGIAMSIAAPRRTFERIFGSRVEDAKDGGWVAESGARELPLERLSQELAGRVEAVTFEPPAETVP